MLRISKLTDYAIVLATHMASCGGPHSVRELSAATNLPAPTSSKVLKKLVKAEVVTSQRGAHGGYQLARRPEDVSVVEIIEAIEGPIAVTECVDTEASECEHVQRCGVRANWQRINQAVFDALDGISLSDMAEPAGARLVQLMRNVGDAERARVNS